MNELSYKEMKEKIKELGLEIPRGKNGGAPSKVLLAEILENHNNDVFDEPLETIHEDVIYSDWHLRRGIKVIRRV